jgi:hypothetical protein
MIHPMITSVRSPSELTAASHAEYLACEMALEHTSSSEIDSSVSAINGCY